MIEKILIGATALVLVLVAILGFKIKADDAARAAHIREMSVAAADYEEEIAALKEDIEKQRGIYETNKKPYGSICFAVKASTPEELSKAAQWVQQYQIPMTMVLDVTMTDEARVALVQEYRRHPGWSIMFTGTGNNWLDRAKEVKDLFQRNNLPECGMLYFENEAEESQLAKMKRLGWETYSNMSVSLDGGYTTLNEDSLLQVAHFTLGSSSVKREEIDALAEAGETIIFTLEMKNVGKTYTEESVQNLFSILSEEYIENELLKPITMDTYIKEYEELKDQFLVNQASFEAYEKECLEKIEELENKIIQLYEF